MRDFIRQALILLYRVSQNYDANSMNVNDLKWMLMIKSCEIIFEYSSYEL